MNRKVSTKFFSAIMVMALAVSANVSGYMGGFDDDRAHVNLNVGSKMINPGDKFGQSVKDMKNQTQFGLDLDYKFDVLPFHIAVGYHASSSKKRIVKLSLSELRLGARKYQDFDMFSIYYGGGLSSVTAKLGSDSYSTSTLDSAALATARATTLATHKTAAKALVTAAAITTAEKTALDNYIDAATTGHTELQALLTALGNGTPLTSIFSFLGRTFLNSTVALVYVTFAPT